MWSGRGVELLVCLCVTLSCVRVITGDNVYRGDFGISTLGWPGNFATFNTVGGTHGWNQPPNGSFFQEWADKTFTNSSAAIGDVFVFQSNSSISPRTTVTVFATYDQSLNRSSICGDTHLTSYYGTNHFSSDVSLMPLQPNMTYWFLSSGAAGDCSSGMVFSVFIRDRSIDFLRDTYEPPFEREVGVVYTAAYQDTRLSYISNLGPYVPEQPVTVGPNSLNDRRFFYGDGVAIAMYKYNTLIRRSKPSTVDGAPVSCSNFSVGEASRVLNDSAVLDYYALYLKPRDEDSEYLISILDGNLTASLADCSTLD